VGLQSRPEVQPTTTWTGTDEGLEDDYAAAIDEWSGSDDERLWEATTADGFIDAAR
jgi:hypothetical protein